MTAGVNPAVAAALRDHGRAGDVVFVGHELTEASIVLLREGVMTLAIDQAPEMQARRAIDLMLRHLGAGGPEALSGEIPFTLHLRENV